MFVKTAEKGNAWQADSFGQWHLLCSHRTGTVGLSKTSFYVAPCKHVWGLLGPVGVCPYIHSHPCLGCREEWTAVWDVGVWACPEGALLQHRHTHHHCLHHRDLLAGKQSSSLVSYQLCEQFGQICSWLLISYYFNTCIIFPWGSYLIYFQ